MSILIKGMAMPKNCLYCPISHWNKLDEITGCEIVIGKKYVDKSDTGFWQEDRPKWCPLVELPSAEPEGDLISKEDVLDEIHRCLEERDYTLGSLYDNVCEMPSAERTGHWIKINDDEGSIWKCSECGELCCCKGNYCMQCGARMVSKK